MSELENAIKGLGDNDGQQFKTSVSDALYGKVSDALNLRKREIGMNLFHEEEPEVEISPETDEPISVEEPADENV
tara:strand:+ start:2009 stop:2233 length:225 start_codon:yes stop_codon:yes gene_type:complete